MLFLSPLFLWGLLAASAPIVIHLINRRRHKTVQWAAMQFLLKATRESRGKRKLRNIIILACRALAIAALVGAAAKPIVSGMMGWGGGSIDTVVLLLDRSASMEIRAGDGQSSRREMILNKVRNAMDALGNPRLVLIDSASMEPQEVPSPDVLTQISSTKPTDSAADFSAMLNRAAEFLAGSTGRAEIWMASDLQSTNWDPNDERWVAAQASLSALAKKPSVRVLSLSGSTASNAGVRLIRSRRSGNEVVLDLELLRSGDARGTTTVPLTTNANGVQTTQSITLPGQSINLQKRISLPEGQEAGFGWVSVPADGNLRDNVAFFAYGPARPMESLVVAPMGEAADYLQLSAAPSGLDNLSTSAVSPSDAASQIAPNLAAILWAAPLPTGRTAEALEQYLQSGGHVMFFPSGEKTNTPFANFVWADVQESPAGQFFILDDWNRSDGVMRDGIDGTPISGKKLLAIRRQIPMGDITSLARWEDGEPMLARRIIDQGTAWMLGSIPDYTWSNLGDGDILLPAVQRMITQGADRFDRSHLAPVGSGSAAVVRNESWSRVDTYRDSMPAKSEYEAGVYQSGTQYLAINRPAEEDEFSILTRDELDLALNGTDYTLFDQAGKESDDTLSKDVWRAFIIAVLLFFLAEALLCLPKKSRFEAMPAKAGA